MPLRRDSVAQHVRNLVYNRPCLLEALRMRIVNYSALAAYLQRELESIGVRAGLSAIKVALVRIARELPGEAPRKSRLAEVIANSTLSLVDDIEVLTIDARRGRGLLPKLLSSARKARFFQLAQSVETMTLMVDRETGEKMREVVGGALLYYLRRQAAVIMKSPPEIVSTPGVVSYLTFLLSSRGVNVTQIISCYRDTILIVDSRDTLLVYTVLKNVMEEYRRALAEKR